MENNDFIKINKKIKYDEIVSKLKNPNVRIIPELSVLLDEIGFSQIINNNPASITAGIGFISLSCYLLTKNIRYEKITYYNNCYSRIQNLLRDTKTYSNCKKEYFDYIQKCNTFIEELNPNNLMEVIVLFQKLLQENYLCKDKKGSYSPDIMPRNDKFCNMFELDELLGCRISTGSYVCRHISSLLNDILSSNTVIKNNNIHSFYTRVWITDDINKVEEYKKNTAPNHAIILFEKNGKYIGYCPTMNCLISVGDYINKTKSTSIKAYDILDKSVRYYGFIPEFYNNFSQEQIRNSNNLNKEYLNQLSTLYMMQKEKIDSYSDTIFIKFYNKTKKNLENMSECIDIMVPQKRKVKQLVIK